MNPIVKGDRLTLPVHPLAQKPDDRRKARLPKWSGRLGQRVKGSVRFGEGGYLVTYSYLIGFESTAKASETFSRWSLAIGEYREHDRTVQEKRRLEKYRHSGEYGKSNPGLAPTTYS